MFINAGNFDANGCTKIITKAIKSSERKRKSEDYYFPLLAHGLGDERISIGIAEIIPRKDVISFARPHINHEHICRVEEFCESNKYPYNHFLNLQLVSAQKKVGEEYRDKSLILLLAFFIYLVSIGVYHLNLYLYQ